MRTLLFSLLLLGGTAACSSQKLEPIPAGVDLSKVPTTTIKMSARKYAFEPAEVHVKAGTLVVLEVTSVEGTHGIAIPDFGLDEPLELNATKTLRFYVPAAGEHKFHCSHFCGMGHLGMKGRIVVE